MHLSKWSLAAASISSYFTVSLCQSTNSSDESNGRWIYDIPPTEAAALAGIVEDVAPGSDRPSPEGRKGNLSPQYDLIYRIALPIPPVKEPVMSVLKPFLQKAS